MVARTARGLALDPIDCVPVEIYKSCHNYHTNFPICLVKSNVQIDRD